MRSEDGQRLLRENLTKLEVAAAVQEDLVAWQTGEVALGVTAAGDPTLVVAGKSLYPQTDTLETVGRQAAELLQGNSAAVVVFFGLGLGLHLEFVRHLTAAPIVVFEPDYDVITGVLARLPLALADTVLVTDTTQLMDAVSGLWQGSAARLVVGALPVWMQHRADDFNGFRDTLSQLVLKQDADRNTQATFAELWIRNVATNLPFVATELSWRVLGERFVGRPAILVGAGPSLDLNLEALAAAQGHALIVAVHSSAEALVRAGIIPDLVVLLEGQELDYYFRDIPHLDELVLVSSPQVHPVQLSLPFKGFLGVSIEGHATADWFEAAYSEGPLPTGGSVATTAFSLLHELGCDPLILVGMDLAYTSARGHARQSATGCCSYTFDEAAGTMSKICDTHPLVVYNALAVPAWGGGEPVPTRTVLDTVRHWFEAAARSWAGGRHLINATEGGARVGGFVESTLAETVAQYCGESVPAAVEIAAAMETAPRRDPQLLVAAVRGELETIGAAAAAAKAADEVAASAIELLTAAQYDQVQPLLEELAGHEQKLSVATGRTRLLNSLIGVKVNALAAESGGDGDAVATTLHSLRQSRQINAVVAEGAQSLLDRFQPVLVQISQARSDSDA